MLNEIYDILREREERVCRILNQNVVFGMDFILRCDLEN